MANSLTDNPWVIDTAQAGVVLFAHQIKVKHFEFSQYTVASANCQVKNQYGKLVWAGEGATSLEEVRSGNVGWIDGLIVDRLDNSGIVRVYFE